MEKQSLEGKINTLSKAILSGMFGMFIGGIIGHGFVDSYIKPELLNAIDVGYIGGYFAGLLPPLISGYIKIRKMK